MANLRNTLTKFRPSFQINFAVVIVLILASTQVVAQDTRAVEELNPEQTDVSDPVESSPEAFSNSSSPSAYGGSLFGSQALGVSAGFHRWLGRIGPHYGDCIGAVLLAAVPDPWAGNHFFFGAVFATAVGQYGDPDAPNLFAAAKSTVEYVDSNRSVGGTAALPPLDFSYSSLAMRASYRLITKSMFSAGAYWDIGYGLIGTLDDAQAHLFSSVGANLIIKFFPSLIMTVGLQYKQDVAFENRLAGFDNMSALAIYNSFELLKF